MERRNEVETVLAFYLGPFGSFPEARSVVGEAFMTMLPSLMLWHMIFAESLAAILTFLVPRCYTSTFIAFFQMSKPASNEIC